MLEVSTTFPPVTTREPGPVSGDATIPPLKVATVAATEPFVRTPPDMAREETVSGPPRFNSPFVIVRLEAELSNPAEPNVVVPVPTVTEPVPRDTPMVPPFKKYEDATSGPVPTRAPPMFTKEDACCIPPIERVPEPLRSMIDDGLS